jgi:hypothetical protein
LQEGVFTVLFGILVYFVLPTSVDTAWFLTAEEKAAYKEDLDQDWSGDTEHEAFEWKQVVNALKTPHVWMMAVPLFMNGM